MPKTGRENPNYCEPISTVARIQRAKEEEAKIQRAKEVFPQNKSMCNSTTPNCHGPDSPKNAATMCTQCKTELRKALNASLNQSNTMMGNKICKKCHTNNAEMVDAEWSYCGKCCRRGSIKESTTQKAKSAVARFFRKSKDDEFRPSSQTIHERRRRVMERLHYYETYYS